MNRFMQEKWPWIEATHAMRDEILNALQDDDLAFNPGGQNMTLGALCREMGELEYDYVQSLKTFTQNWAYRNTEPGLDCSADRLKAWYQALDGELKAVVEAFSDDDLNKTVTRDSGYSMPVELQLEVYLQALLIFTGKASIFLKAMNKPLPQYIKEYVW
jgi:hypothetical protein